MAPSSEFSTKNWTNEVTSGIDLPYRPGVAIVATLRGDSQAASSFFAFPPELRNLIYYHLLTTGYTVGRSRPSRFKKTIDHASSYCEIWNSPRFNVLQVCQQARDEALHTIYKKGRFYLPIRRREPAPPYLSYETVSARLNARMEVMLMGCSRSLQGQMLDLGRPSWLLVCSEERTKTRCVLFDAAVFHIIWVSTPQVPIIIISCP